MGKGRRPTAKSILATLIVVATITLATYLGAFENLGAWAHQLGPGQLGASFAIFTILTVASGFYCLRGRSQLRRETMRHEREVADLEREVAELGRTSESLQRKAATYRGVVANLPVALFAVDSEGVFTLSEGTGLELLGLEPDKVIGQSIFETYRNAPKIVENVRLALGGRASGAIVEVGGRAFETRYSPLREYGEFSGVLGVATDVTERRSAENRLREAEARYRTLVEQIPAITYVEELSRNGKILVYMSPQYEAMLGYSPEEGISHPEHWLDVIHPEDRERVLAEDQRTDESLEPFRAEYRVIAKGGRVVWVRDEAVLVRDERGEPLFWQGVMHDITEGKKAEEKLQEAEERYRTLVEQIPAIVYIDTLESVGYGRYTSPQAEALLGYPISAWDADPLLWTKLVHPDDHERVLAENQRANTECVPLVLEYRMIAEDGRVVWLRDESVILWDGEGQPWRRQGIMHDVTERVRAEEALRVAEERYRTLVEQIPAVTYIDRADGSDEPLYTSPQIEEMLGYTPEEWMGGRLWPERLHPDDRRMLAADERFKAGADERFSEEYRLIAKDGRMVWVHEEAVALKNEAGESLYWQGVIFDITERKKAEERLRASESELRALFSAMTDVVLELDYEGRYLKVAPTNPSLLYASAAKRLGKTLHEILPTHIADMLLDHVKRALKERRKFDVEYSLPIDGEEIWFASTISPMSEDRVVLVGRDVTERKKAEEALKESEAILAEAQRMAHLGSWEWDVRRDQLRWSDETFRIYGCEPQEFVPTFDKLLEVVHPEDRKMLSKHLDATLQEDEPYDFEHRIVRPDGEVRVVHRRAEVVRDESGEPLKMVGTIHDVTERKALKERLEHQALHDPLTGLPNRTLFTDRLRQALSRAKRRRRPLAVMFMDLDNFKVINDSLGHSAGDKVLKAASTRAQSVLRPEDTVARLGGDELIFLLEDVDAAGAERAAERVQEQLQAPFSVGGRRLFVTSSIGIAIGGVNGKQAADLLRDADVAMYRAKHSGKARYTVFKEGMNTRALKRLELQHDLRRALERGEFRIYYQPQMRLDTHIQRHLRSAGSRAIISPRVAQAPRIVGVEALVRWEHPERGLLLPDDFIPLAEETGLIVDIGEAVLAEACRRTKEWHAHFPVDPPLAMCVNLSAKQFRESDLTETVRRVLTETELDPRHLHLEITESTAMGDAPATVATLEELKELGVRMVIDDFGTGYSSLSYLERFPVDQVKIDRSFVAKLGEDPGATALVSGMIRLAHSLNLEVIAEGVETEAQLGRLQGLGCDLAQGQYFYGSITGEAMSALVETNAPTSISRLRPD